MQETQIVYHLLHKYAAQEGFFRARTLSGHRLNGVPNDFTRGFAGARSGGKRAAAAHVGHMAAYVARSSDPSQSIWHAL